MEKEGKAVTDIEMWNLIVGFAAPWVVAFINRPYWPPMAKALMAVFVSAVGGFVTTYLAGNLDGQTLVTSVLLVMVAMTSFYKGLWQPTNIVPKLEVATTPRAALARAAITARKAA